MSQRLIAIAILCGAILCMSPALIRAEDATAKMRLEAVDGIEFVIDHEIPAERLAELAANMRAVERQLQDKLGVPGLTQTLRVYLFADGAAFSKYVRKHIPSVGVLDTARHGMFLLREGKPYLFVVATDDLVSSLRHETVHAVLNTSHPGLPIWIDEGLAQCHESPVGDYWDDGAAEILEKDLFRRSPPKAKDLEKNRTMPELSRRDYAGCWLSMYELMSNDAGRAQLSAYLAALREKRSPKSVADIVPVLHEVPARR